MQSAAAQFRNITVACSIPSKDGCCADAGNADEIEEWHPPTMPHTAETIYEVQGDHEAIDTLRRIVRLHTVTDLGNLVWEL